MLTITHYTERNESSKIWTRVWMAISCVFNILFYSVGDDTHHRHPCHCRRRRRRRQWHPFILPMLVFSGKTFTQYRWSIIARVSLCVWSITETNSGHLYACKCFHTVLHGQIVAMAFDFLQFQHCTQHRGGLDSSHACVDILYWERFAPEQIHCSFVLSGDPWFLVLCPYSHSATRDADKRKFATLRAKVYSVVLGTAHRIFWRQQKRIHSSSANKMHDKDEREN